MGTKIFVVVTVLEGGDTDIFGDVVLITTDEAQAIDIKDRLDARRPIANFEYDKLVAFDHAVYFTRNLNDLSNWGKDDDN